MDVVGNSQHLAAWQKSVNLAGKVYAATRRLPSEEEHSLHPRLRQAAVAVASNIAEAAAQRSRAAFIRRVYIARAALSEVETQLLIALDQGYLSADDAPLNDIAEVRGLLAELLHSITCAARIAHAKACAPVGNLSMAKPAGKQG